MKAAAAILIIAYVMPGRIPDVTQQIAEESVALCWPDAKKFVARGVPEMVKQKGAVAVYAACKMDASASIDE